MPVSEKIEVLRSRLSYSGKWGKLKDWKNRISGFRLHPNECMYAVSIPDKAIIYHRGFENLGWSVHDNHCLLDVEFAYQVISQQDKEDVEFISDEVLDVDHIFSFDGHILYVDYRGQKRNGVPLRIERTCQIDVYDEERKPMGYLTILRFFEKSYELERGVEFELFSKTGTENSFTSSLECAYFEWKHSKCPVSDRELEVYNLYDKGFSTSKEIGAILGLHKQTVDGYFKTAKQKMKEIEPLLDNKIDILRYLKSNGYLNILKYMGPIGPSAFPFARP